MLVEHEQRAFALQVSHEARHGDLGRDAYQHVDVVLHEVPLDYLHPLPLAELPEDLPQVLAVLVVDCFPSILWAKHDVVLAHPFGVRKAVRFLCHGVLLSLAAGDLNNHHPRGKGVLLHSISVIHPHSGWFFALCASHAGQAHEPQRIKMPLRRVAFSKISISLAVYNHVFEVSLVQNNVSIWHPI